MALEEVKSRLHIQFGHEPSLVEWAEAVGLSSRELKSQIHCGNSSREKLIYANFRMVVHIAKKYQGQGQGLGLQDLLQVNQNGHNFPKFSSFGIIYFLFIMGLILL